MDQFLKMGNELRRKIKSDNRNMNEVAYSAGVARRTLIRVLQGEHVTVDTYNKILAELGMQLTIGMEKAN